MSSKTTEPSSRSTTASDDENAPEPGACRDDVATRRAQEGGKRELSHPTRVEHFLTMAWLTSFVLAVIVVGIGVTDVALSSEQVEPGHSTGTAAPRGTQSSTTSSGVEVGGLPGPPQETSTTRAEARAITSHTVPVPAAAHTIGETVTSGKYEVAFLGHKSLGTKVGRYAPAEAHGQWIQVDLSVKNLTNTVQTFESTGGRLIDSSHQVFAPDLVESMVASGADGQLRREIRAGETVTQSLLFDVPRDVDFVQFAYEQGYSGQELRVALGTDA